LGQFFITDLGRDEPTILLTNDTCSTVKTLITRCAKRYIAKKKLPSNYDQELLLHAFKGRVSKVRHFAALHPAQKSLY